MPTFKSCWLHRRGTHNPLPGPVFCWSGVGGKFPGFLSTLHGAASKGTRSCPERIGHGYWTKQKAIVRGQSQVAMCTTLNTRKFNTRIMKCNEKSKNFLVIGSLELWQNPYSLHSYCIDMYSNRPTLLCLYCHFYLCVCVLLLPWILLPP